MSESGGMSAAGQTAGGRAAAAGSVPDQRRAWMSLRPRSSAPRQLDFPPVRNGLDYLASVVEHLDETESEVRPRDVKYAVLHLQAAVEVLFKARLLAEHWTLVFTNPGDATRKALDDATLNSVSPEKAITRLRTIVGVPISDKEQQALKKLTEDRNKLQHFGLTQNARAVEARAGEVLDFLIRFIDTQLMPYLSTEEQRETAHGLEDLREGLGNINSYVDQRMKRIAGELRDDQLENVTILCPACEKVTLVLDEAPSTLADEGGYATCRFCSSFFEISELENRWFPVPWNDEGRHPDANVCPWCEAVALGTDVPVLSEPEPVHFCFSCSRIIKELAPCDGCGRQIDVSAEGSAPLCGPCEASWEPEPEYELPYEGPEDYGFTEERE
ncbi:serine/arginine repetitive matrix protein 1 [Streptomyces sp. NPDC059567]|uniref:serine/arginine repetitive matrix protein 1 n=1 Tax=Streptomyces sp. NPDC059567 TaxID=3346867 RepID=UPI0036B07D57